MTSAIARRDRLARRMLTTLQLVRVLAPREVRVRYRQSILTVAWAFITPVAILAVYGTVLTRSLGVTGTRAPYLVTAWVGLVLWTFFSTAVGGAVTSLTQSSELVTKMYFPREALPLATVGAALPELLIGMLTVVGLALVQGVGFGRNAAFVVLPLLLIVVWSAAISVLTAVLATFARDFVHGTHLALRVGFFACPVVYEASFMPDAFRWTTQWNPVAVAITATRESLLYDSRPSLRLVGLHVAAALAFLLVTVLYTRSVEGRIVDLV